MFVISFAMTCPSTSDRLLDGNDFSYGVYIYHMLVVNTLVELGWLQQADISRGYGCRYGNPRGCVMAMVERPHCV